MNLKKNKIKNNPKMIIGLIVTTVVTVMLHFIIVNPIGNLFGFGLKSKLIIDCVVWFVSFGQWNLKSNQYDFYEKYGGNIK